MCNAGLELTAPNGCKSRCRLGFQVPRLPIMAVARHVATHTSPTQSCCTPERAGIAFLLANQC